MEDLQQLIEDCVNRNRLAEQKLYLKFYKPLYFLCRRFFPTSNEALECLNDGMLKIYSGLAKYKSAEGELFNWMYTVIRNTAIDKVRVGKKKWLTVELSEIRDFDQNFSPLQKLEWKDIYALLDVLPPATRIVCTLFYIEGYRVKEISTRLEISSGTVKWHLSEVRMRLNPVLKNYLKRTPFET